MFRLTLEHAEPIENVPDDVCRILGFVPDGIDGRCEGWYVLHRQHEWKENGSSNLHWWYQWHDDWRYSLVTLPSLFILLPPGPEGPLDDY